MGRCFPSLTVRLLFAIFHYPLTLNISSALDLGLSQTRGAGWALTPPPPPPSREKKEGKKRRKKEKTFGGCEDLITIRVMV